MFDWLRRKNQPDTEAVERIDRKSKETLELVSDLQQRRERLTGNMVRDRILPPASPRRRVTHNG